MYKIYINDKALVLCTSKEYNNLTFSEHDLAFIYTGIKKRLHNVIDMLEKGTKYDRIIIHSQDIISLWKDFISLHKKITACGGIVINEKNELLAIFRRGFWDLPKGKKDSGEKKKECALREVKEETGIKSLKMKEKAGITYHTYREKGRKILKKSHWYFMASTSNEKLIPEKEEDIQEVLWIEKNELLLKQKVYANIRDLLG